jgi:glucose dehydrogenase
MPSQILNNYDQSLNIYPNPSNSQISINVNNANIDLVALYDNQGRLIIEFNNVSASSLDIDVSNISAGFYTLKVLSLSELKSRKLIIY